jgi:hypothetical protein
VSAATTLPSSTSAAAADVAEFAIDEKVDIIKAPGGQLAASAVVVSTDAGYQLPGQAKLKVRTSPIAAPCGASAFLWYPSELATGPAAVVRFRVPELLLGHCR